VLTISSLNVLIGANGAGKSNFIGFFKFLRKLIDANLQQYTAHIGGAERILHYGSKQTKSLTCELDFSPNMYAVKLVPSQGDRLIFESEQADYAPNGATYTTNLNRTIHESDLKDSNPSSIPGFVYSVLSSWRLYHFHDTSDSALVKKTGDINDTAYLREDASNLAAFLHAMSSSHPLHYKRIVKTVRRIVPDFKDFYLEPLQSNPETILLRWYDKHHDTPFRADDFSDGSLRFICLVVLLLQPNLPPLILIDEPELGLHPNAIDLMTELLKFAADSTQLIVATQSERVVSMMEPNDVIVVDKEAGASTFKRLNKEQLSYWLEKYNLGEMWEQNMIGGQP
jgi:predicted ATPase